MKTVLPAIAAILLSCVLGMMMLASFDHLPDGSRALVIGKHVLLAAVSVGLLSSLYLIPPANRNLASFLKAFVLLAAMSSLGMCSGWSARFNGPPHRIVGEDHRVSVEVPSDWSAQRPAPEGSALMAMDWAGTRSVNIVLGDEVGDLDPTQAIDAMLRQVREHALGNFGAPIASADCGPDCAADVFATRARGKDFQVISAVRIGCGRIMLVHSSFMPDTRRDLDTQRREGADLVATVRCTDRP